MCELCTTRRRSIESNQEYMKSLVGSIPSSITIIPHIRHEDANPPSYTMMTTSGSTSIEPSDLDLTVEWFEKHLNRKLTFDELLRVKNDIN